MAAGGTSESGVGMASVDGTGDGYTKECGSGSRHEACTRTSASAGATLRPASSTTSVVMTALLSQLQLLLQLHISLSLGLGLPYRWLLAAPARAHRAEAVAALHLLEVILPQLVPLVAHCAQHGLALSAWQVGA